MLAAERHRQILSLVDIQGSVRTTELARALEVTDETIRRDLEQLDRERQLQRTHGGAIRLRRENQEQPYDARKIQHIAEKKEIAGQAVKLIEPGETVYFDGSSTVLQMAPLVAELPITVITNSHLVVATLREAEGLTLVSTGGRFDFGSRTYVGSQAEAAVRRYRIDKLFFSGNGVCAERGVSEINEGQAMLKEVALSCARTAVCLADYSKLGKESSFYFAPPARLDYVITNSGASESTTTALREGGVQVEVCGLAE